MRRSVREREHADGACRRSMPTERADGACRRIMPTERADGVCGRSVRADGVRRPVPEVLSSAEPDAVGRRRAPQDDAVGAGALALALRPSRNALFVRSFCLFILFVCLFVCLLVCLCCELRGHRMGMLESSAVTVRPHEVSVQHATL